jgi:hypothetical protein
MEHRRGRSDKSIEWTDILFIPSSLALAFVFVRWLSWPLAMTISVVLNLLIFAMFEPKVPGVKRFVLAIITAAIITFVLAMLFNRGFL